MTDEILHKDTQIMSNQELEKIELTEKQNEAIELIISGLLTYTDVAKQVGICRKTLYNWFEIRAFRAAIEERRNEIKTKIGNSWVSIFSISTEGLLKRVKAGDTGSQEFALKCMMSTLSKDGKGLLLLPDNSGSSLLSNELGSIITSDMKIKYIIDNVKILVDPKTKREDFLNAIDVICALATGLLTDDELKERIFTEDELDEMRAICKNTKNIPVSMGKEKEL